MPVNECIPSVEAAYTQKLTVHADAALYGKRFCGPLTTYQDSGPGLAPDPLTGTPGGNLRCAGLPSAGGQVGGVVAWDVAANGKANVIRGAGTILPVLSGGVVTAGADVKVDAAGKVVDWATSGLRVGKAHTGAAGADTEVMVELYALTGMTG